MVNQKAFTVSAYLQLPRLKKNKSNCVLKNDILSTFIYSLKKKAETKYINLINFGAYEIKTEI